MGKFVTIIILGVIGYFGYQWFGSAETVEQQPTSTDGGDGSVPDFSEGSAQNGDQADLANPENPGVKAEFSAALKEAEALWKQYQDEKTDATLHDKAPSLAGMYSQLLLATYNKPALKKVQLQLVKERLNPLSKRLFFSSKSYKNDDSGLFVYYTIKSGDLFPAIGRKYGMSEQFINVLRGRDAGNEVYGVGDELKLVDAKQQGYFMHIDKSDFYMDVFVCGVFIRRYPIGHGAIETETPTGETYVESRVLHPQWTNPKTKQVFNYGEPGHILGPVWMAFNKEIGKSGLGIHGYTGDGQATGVRGSNGCIRMKNEQAVELYNILVPAAYYNSGFKSRAPMRVRIVE